MLRRSIWNPDFSLFWVWDLVRKNRVDVPSSELLCLEMFGWIPSWAFGATIPRQGAVVALDVEELLAAHI